MPAWASELTWFTLLDFYLVYILVVVILKFVLHNKRLLSMFFFFLLMLGLFLLAEVLDLKVSREVYRNVPLVFLIFILVVGAPDIRLTLETLWKESIKSQSLLMGTDRTKNEILNSVSILAKSKVGALITIEKHNTLDQYAQTAIMLNSDVSKELLTNIFTPNTPLHDGAVIIRGDKILCAGAYYVLTSSGEFDKTTGSRHRAALGISEITDSLTVVVSEETGSISVAVNGVMTTLKDVHSLNEYLTLFMK
ncbi:MAG: DNA integrity scanning protein DisA nucleotide-binding domain protein [Acholeplasmataceae bacterium]